MVGLRRAGTAAFLHTVCIKEFPKTIHGIIVIGTMFQDGIFPTSGLVVKVPVDPIPKVGQKALGIPLA